MNDSLPTPTGSTPDLQAAVRRARLEDAERSSMAADLRQAEIARLESLNEALQPVFAQLPREAEMFDHGLVPLEKPRLFVDMIAYVEMARDRRTFRFMQESRAGRALIAESDEIVRMAEAVTFYLGRRVVEREKAIVRDAHFKPQDTQPAPEALPPPRAAAVPEAAPVEDEVALPVARRGFSGVDVFFAFILGGVAMLALFVIAAWLDMKTLWPFGKLLG
jgi:hypothetical protein